MEQHVQLLTDKNESTCLAIPNCRPVQLVADLTFRPQMEDTTVGNVVLQIQLSSFTDCQRFVVFNSTRPENCTSGQNVQGVIGEMIPTITSNNFCYYKLPVVCRSSFCEVHGYLATRNEASQEIVICELRQG